MSESEHLHLLEQFAAAVAEDLALLATLHDCELTATTLSLLRARRFPDDLALRLENPLAIDAQALLRSALGELGDDAGPLELDILAVDYAAIYLNHTLRAAPNESVWLDEEELAMQAPMFEVREWMARHRLEVNNWRIRPEDHLVHELDFLAYLMRSSTVQSALPEAADFLDRHLLRWVNEFSGRIAARCGTPFYAGLNALTACYLEEIRDLIAKITGDSRPTRAEIDSRIESEQQRTKPAPASIPLRYVPGSIPSW